jgi:hypothetical protein
MTTVMARAPKPVGWHRREDHDVLDERRQIAGEQVEAAEDKPCPETRTATGR